MPLIVLVALYILLEEFLQSFVKPLVDRISAWRILQTVEKFLQKRSPYTLFAIYVCKLSIFSGIKFFSLYLISQKQVYGIYLLTCGELCGAMITVWYAKVALPILLTLSWFNKIYQKLVSIKNWIVGHLKALAIYQYVKIKIQHMKRKLKEIKQRQSKFGIFHKFGKLVGFVKNKITG
jgi:hypothetical protein